MTELLTKILGSLVRAALVALSGWLVAHHQIADPAAASWVEAAYTNVMNVLPGLIAVIWSAWAKKNDVVVTNTALAAPAGATIEDVKETIKAGKGQPAT